MESLFFYLFGGLAVVTTLLTLSSKNPVYSAIWMILSFSATAGLFVLLDAFLIATVEVLVYAGAIMVLFLFVIMMINLRTSEAERLRLSPLAILAALTFLVLFGRAVSDPGPMLGKAPNDLVGDPDVIANLMFTEYVVPFEALSLLLTAAVVGCVVLSRKKVKA
ncbi:MAG: NADH dehydrogenase subunit J [Planctomycetota bacterium]|nr:MAG: NADH dehydrogenase subunit J [Planctomycetota bacterium]